MMAESACMELLTASTHLAPVLWRASHDSSADDSEAPPPSPRPAAAVPPPAPPEAAPGPAAPGGPPSAANPPPAAAVAGRASGNVPLCAVRVPAHAHVADATSATPSAPIASPPAVIRPRKPR